MSKAATADQEEPQKKKKKNEIPVKKFLSDIAENMSSPEKINAGVEKGEAFRKKNENHRCLCV